LFLHRGGFIISPIQIVPQGLEILVGVVLELSRVEENQDGYAYAAIHLTAAFLIYLFGVLVFLPFAKRIGFEGIEMLVSAIFLVVVAIFLVRGYPYLETVLNLVAVKISGWWMGRKGLDESKRSAVLRACYLWVSIIGLFLVYLMLSPLLRSIHPGLNGLALIGVIITNIYIYTSKSYSK
jgi:hypothetical protein